MNSFTSLSYTQFRILGILDEAGEDYVTALLNSVVKCNGDDREVGTFIAALLGLLQRGLVEFARMRDPATLKWLADYTSETYNDVARLRSCISWTEEQRLWKWTASSTIITVLLTQSGCAAAEEILSKFGYDIAAPEKDDVSPE